RFAPGMKNRTSLALGLALGLAAIGPTRADDPSTAPPPAASAAPREVAAAIDAFLDRRFEPAPAEPLLRAIEQAHLDIAAVERTIRAGRASYGEPPQPRGRLTADLPLVCDHVDHATRYLIYVPTAYDPKKPASLVVVGHGGSAGRDLAFGKRAALLGIQPSW